MSKFRQLSAETAIAKIKIELCELREEVKMWEREYKALVKKIDDLVSKDD